VLGRLDAILLRERISVGHLRECDADLSRVHLCSDMAFYWRRMAPQLFVAKRGPARRIALSFRQWSHHNVATGTLTARAAALCAHLLRGDPFRELLFLSTCQGIPEYLDDSNMARAIVGSLPADLQARCRIDAQRHGPEALIDRYAGVDAYVGMRLHGAILSMLGGTPAMAIAYEDKTPGVYSTLGLDDFQIDHRASQDEWIRRADAFFGRIDVVRAALPGALERAASSLDAAMNVVRAAVHGEPIEADPSAAGRLVPAHLATGGRHR
jgi:colanic acid/amylovoran biosynthesis protein